MLHGTGVLRSDSAVDGFSAFLFCSLDVVSRPIDCQRSFTFPEYTVHNVPADGQCAFSAISHQLSTKKYIQTHVTGDIVRRQVVEFFSCNENLKLAIKERLCEQSIDDYIGKMSSKTTWADENILFVASVCYDVELQILRDDGTPTLRIGSSTANRSITLGYVSLSPGESPSHYISLVPHSTSVNKTSSSCKPPPRR